MKLVVQNKHMLEYWTAATGAKHPSVQSEKVDTRVLVGRTLAEVERSLILDTLSACQWNRTHAAKILGVSIRTMRNRLRQFASEGLNILPSQHYSAGTQGAGIK